MAKNFTMHMFVLLDSDNEKPLSKTMRYSSKVLHEDTQESWRPNKIGGRKLKQHLLDYLLASHPHPHEFQYHHLNFHLGLSLLCSKIYLFFLPELPKNFTHYS